MREIAKLLLPCLLASLLASCDREAPPAARLEPPEPPADYVRHLLFVAAPPATEKLVLELVARDRADSVHHAASGWVQTDGEWSRILEDAWSGPAFRAAWRPLPHGALRIVAGPNDAMEAVVIRRAAGELRLRFRAELRVAQPEPERTLVLQEATLVLAGRTVPGVILDVQRVRSPAAESGDQEEAVREVIGVMIGERTQLGYADGMLLWGSGRRVPRRPDSGQLQRTPEQWVLSAGGRRESTLARLEPDAPVSAGDRRIVTAAAAPTSAGRPEFAAGLFLELPR